MVKMYDRIAVIYRGHLRTWDYTKENNFAYFEKISKNVDYYFVTWDLPYNFKSIKKDFKNRDLIKLLPVNIVPEYYNHQRGPGWLSYNIVPFKNEREKEVTYDVVFDLRPDIFVTDFFRFNKDLVCLKDKTLYTSWNQKIYGWEGIAIEMLYEHGIDDVFAMMKSDVYDILSQRYKHKVVDDAHINYRRFCDKNNIEISTDMITIPLLIRPNMLDSLPPNILVGNTPMAHNYWVVWERIPQESKKRILKRHKILFEDYFVS